MQTEDYVSKYQQIVKGYNDGAVKIYSEDGENRVLTKEEALQKLTGSFEDHAKAMEERIRQQDLAAGMLEDSIRKSSAWRNSSQRAQKFLDEQEKKRIDSESQQGYFSDNIIKAGATFRDMFAKAWQI